MTPATPPTNSAPIGCMTSEPAHTATSPASAPLWMKPGSLSPAISAARMPPHMAISELMAMSPVTVLSDWALMTLKPNQPMHNSQVPMASQGIDDGGMPARPLS